VTASDVIAAEAASLSWADRYGGTTRDVYWRTLLDLARAEDRIFCLEADVGSVAETFATQFPSRYANVGIAEANLMGVAAGLAAVGWLPYVHTFSGFAACRACEQLKIDVAGNNLPVRVAVTHGGMSAGHYGPSHHALDDMAIVRAMPNMTVIIAADTVETEQAVLATAQLPGPLYLRLGRAPTPLVYHEPYAFRPGHAVLLRPGDDVTIVAAGPYPVTMALAAHDELAAGFGVRARVLNMHTIKPLDRAALVQCATETGAVVTVEDHVLAGGLGGAVCETLAETIPCPVRRIGVPDAFFDRVGGERQLLEAAGVNLVSIVTAAMELTGAWGSHRG
jgi:transketolase